MSEQLEKRVIQEAFWPPESRCEKNKVGEIFSEDHGHFTQVTGEFYGREVYSHPVLARIGRVSMPGLDLRVEWAKMRAHANIQSKADETFSPFSASRHSA